MPYLTLLPLDAQQRKYDMREVFNVLRWLVRIGAQWEYLPLDFPHAASATTRMPKARGLQGGREVRGRRARKERGRWGNVRDSPG
jgi:transposase